MKNVDIPVLKPNRTFVYFQGKANLKKAVVSKRRIRRLRWWLGVIFRRKQRIALPLELSVEYDGNAWCFTICERSGLCGTSRLERCDRVLLRPQTPELRVIFNRKRPWVAETYRILFGKIFYGDREQFSCGDVFSLETLRTDGIRALHCRDVAGLKEVILTHCKVRSADGETMAIHGPDALEIIGKVRLPPPEKSRIISAKFLVHFSDRTSVARVKIRHGNRAEFPPEVSEMIEQWLIERGFKYGNGHEK